MKTVADIAALEALYTRKPSDASIQKVATTVTDEYAAWIKASKFCVLTTVGPGGTDGSPRGDDGPVVHIENDKTLLMPDWRGNNRLDSLRNIVLDGRVSLMFMVTGNNNVVRVNGTAVLSDDDTVTSRFEQGGKYPVSVVIVTVDEIYSQCSRAILRSKIWDGTPAPSLPSMGDILKAQTKGAFDGAAYDAQQHDRAKKTMW